MSRYNNPGNDDSNDNDYDDQFSLKLKQYTTIRFTLDRLTEHTHQQFGTSLITNLNGTEMLDGVALRRSDKPKTVNIYSLDTFFTLDEETGQVFQTEDMEEEMSAQEVLESARVAGYSVKGGQQEYFFEPIGVVIEGTEDIAIADGQDDIEVTDDPAIQFGDASMFLGNKTWTRTFAKKITQMGDDVVNDNGEDPTPRGEPDENPKYSSHDWLATDDPTLRSDLEERELILFVTEDTIELDDGETAYSTPNLLDVKTGEFVTIDNDNADEQSSSTSDGESDDDSGTNPEGALPAGVPDSLDNLLDYMARNGKTAPQDIREFAEDEVDDADIVDWEAAADVAEARA